MVARAPGVKGLCWMSSGHDGVPTWNGEADTFESFATACKWYQKSLKDSEQKQAASKVWQKLTGAAKAVVKHLNPDEFEGLDGLQRLVEVLRSSPLQQLPIPDSFSRLEAWRHLRRGQRESIPQLLVREEDLFTQLQQSLSRARKDKGLTPSQLQDRVGPPPRRLDPPSTPSQSPVAAARRQEAAEQSAPTPRPQQAAEPAGTSSFSNFFEDELRGYRLLKAAHLSQTERQHVLVQTQNSTHYYAIRLALRTLFSEDADRSSQHGDRRAKAWWHEDGASWEHSEWSPQGDIEWHGDEWNDWSPSSWDQWNEPNSDAWFSADWEWFDDGSWWTAEDQWESEIQPDEGSDLPEESQLQEALALAGEANRTLHEAREAVRKTRQARGYYAPESTGGKGMKGSPASSPSSSKGRQPCLTCGKPDHSYERCPDRFSKGQLGGFPKGKSGGYRSSNKGKGYGKKGKGKGFGFKGKPTGNTLFFRALCASELGRVWKAISGGYKGCHWHWSNGKCSWCCVLGSACAGCRVPLHRESWEPPCLPLREWFESTSYELCNAAWHGFG